MKIFVKRDLDGFFGLFVDNLVQLLMIVSLLGSPFVWGDTEESLSLIYTKILPGAAISILLGNLFYAWQAHRLAKRTGREDVCALPYGINTPSLLVYVFFVIKPVYDATGDITRSWVMGLLACLGSGVIEFVGSFVGGTIRRHTPRAALLSTLAGIAIGFISMTFALQIFHKPMIALLPLMLVLIGLFSRIRLPLGLPSGLLAVAIGTAIAWGLTLVNSQLPQAPEWLTFGAINPADVVDAQERVAMALPQWCWPELQPILEDVNGWLPFLTVIIPMGLFNVIGSMQNIESAEAAGDSYHTASSMAANGIGTIVASLFGSCFPTTIYIGHPGWKSMGARAGYSTLNGIVIVALCLSGVVSLVAGAVPIEVGAGIVLWIGIIITAQAFRAVEEDHASAVAVGLFPAIAAWGATVMMGTVLAAQGNTLMDLIAPADAQAQIAASAEGEIASPEVSSAPQPVAHPATEVNGFLVHGLLLMERGYIFTCMILAAMSACLIDRRFVAAGCWMIAASALTFLGMMHAYQVYDGMTFDYLFRFVDPHEGSFFYRANDIALAYLLCGLLFIALSKMAQKPPTSSS